MYIDSLDIKRGTDDKLLRHIQFHMGTNIVTDDQNSQMHNGAGKTTALRLLDVVFGSKDKRLLYKDVETGNVNEKLQQFIEKERVTVSCRISNALPVSDTTEVHILEVELFKGGKRHIDGKHYSQSDYWKRLNELLFKRVDSKPSFRQLISPFLRISMKGDDDTFLHCIGSFAKNVDYRSLYSCLFGMADPQTCNDITKSEEELGGIENARKEYNRLLNTGIGDSAQQCTLLNEDIDEASRLLARLNDIMQPEVFQENRDRITKVRKEYEKVNKELSDVQYQIRLNKESLEYAEWEKNDAPEETIMRRFYDEIQELKPSIRKSFDDLVAFNRQLGKNEIEYFKEVGEQLNNKEKDVLARKAAIKEKDKQFLAILSSSDITEYEDTQKQLSEVQQRIGKREQILRTLRDFDYQHEQLSKRIATLKRQDTYGKSDPQKVVNLFTDRYFKPLAGKINGEQPDLKYDSEFDKFPLVVSALSNGTSTGKRKSLIIAYDFAYQKFAADKHIQIPQFVVHDVLENIEENALKEAVRIANDSSFQYIAAMLHSKLESTGFTKQQLNDMVVLTLSEGDKLFKDSHS